MIQLIEIRLRIIKHANENGVHKHYCVKKGHETWPPYEGYKQFTDKGQMYTSEPAQKEAAAQIMVLTEYISEKLT